MRYCDAVTSATGFGYWMFPPMDFRLMWTGTSIVWAESEDDDWQPLSETDSGAVQFPEFQMTFDAAAPAHIQGYAPPFIVALPEIGSVQIWTGFLAQTRPGWSLNVRAPVNLPPQQGVATWEGIVETDLWFGPLFNNFRLTHTNVPVVFRANTPFLQIQPIPQLAYRDALLSDIDIQDVDKLSPTDWDAFAKVVLPSATPDTRQGDYAVAVRRRRRCPVSAALLESSIGDGR